MQNPILVELTRGGIVESFHTGALAVADSKGHVVTSTGDIDRPIYPRSAIKAFQALPVLETGTATHFGYGNKEIAFLCASHAGTETHVNLAANMLARAGQTRDDLACGPHQPTYEHAAHELYKSGHTPTRLHNNCSGKHSGMIATCVHCGDPVTNYCDLNHPHQKRIAVTLADFTGYDITHGTVGVDGCSAPNWAIPLRHLAHAFARFITRDGLSPERARHCKTIATACMAEPYFVAGPERLDTVAMTQFPGRVFMKTGAEAVYCGAFPSTGLGFALKIDDGSRRASEALMTSLLQHHFRVSDNFGALGPFNNYAGLPAGDTRLSETALRCLENVPPPA